MSPAWARRSGWAIYLYANEPHRVPHVAVRGSGYRANVRIADGAVLAGHLPPQVLREVRQLLATHRALAARAFEQTAAHAFPGTLEDMLGEAENPEEVDDDDDRS